MGCLSGQIAVTVAKKGTYPSSDNCSSSSLVGFVFCSSCAFCPSFVLCSSCAFCPSGFVFCTSCVFCTSWVWGDVCRWDAAGTWSSGVPRLDWEMEFSIVWVQWLFDWSMWKTNNWNISLGLKVYIYFHNWLEVDRLWHKVYQGHL